MTENISFYLKSKENQLSYPPHRYPLTHSIYNQIVLKKFSNGPLLITAFAFSFCCIFYLTYFHHQQINIYNIFYGPFHLNLADFKGHVKDFQKNQNKFEYIQVELGEDNVQTPSSSFETIRQYSKPITSRSNHHIATFKILKDPKIYIKLPSRFVDHVNTKFPFNFSKFSLKTLKCITKLLLSKSPQQSLIKLRRKEGLLEYIDAEYSKNSTSFNMIVLTKCGILIGYLYKPFNLKLHLYQSTQEHYFYPLDIALETTMPYFSLLPFILYIVLLVMGSFCLMQYCIILIKYQCSSLPLFIDENVENQLYHLRIQGPLHQQLLKLDEFIQSCECQFRDQLFFIKNDKGKEFVVILSVKLGELKTCENLLPFMICPVLKIEGVTSEAIYYRDGWECNILWPKMSPKEKFDFAKWLHEKLMDISESYRNADDKIELENLIAEEEEKIFEKRNPLFAYARRHSESDIHESLESFNVDDRPVSARLIATFRLHYMRHPKIVDETMKKKKAENGERCAICLYKFDLNELYAVWPGTSTAQHIFHFDCILDQFRTDVRCPLCREPARFN